METFLKTAQAALGIGLEPGEMNVWQICLRALVIFIAALVIMRVANRRFLSKLSPLDATLGFVLASMLARAINGSGPLLESIAAGFLLIFLHRGLAAITARFDWIGKIVKGEPHVLVTEGIVNDSALSKHNISHKDLAESLRIGGAESPEEVVKATLERDGSISVIKER
jgi:uncharacterized membrane protein YcaP (DUF421 family)